MRKWASGQKQLSLVSQRMQGGRPDLTLTKQREKERLIRIPKLKLRWIAQITQQSDQIWNKQEK